MKKILVLLMALCLVGCSNGGKVEDTVEPTMTPSVEPTEETVETTSPEEEIMVFGDVEVSDEMKDKIATLYTCMEEPIQYALTGLDETVFNSFAFVDWQEGIEAVAADALVNAIPHSVVLIKVPETVDGEALAKEIEDNAQLNKWVCVQAEAKAAVFKDGYILLVMSTQDTVDAFVSAFEAM